MRRPAGRPPVTGETRDRYIQVRASLSEVAVWKLAAEVVGQDFSPFNRDSLNKRSLDVLGLGGSSTTIRHVSDLLGRDEDTILKTAALDGEKIGAGGRVRTEWALSRIACDADPKTAAPQPWAVRRHRRK